MNTDFINILNLPSLIRIRENSWNGKNFIDLERMITTDPDVISARLDAMEDIMASDALFEGIKEILPKIAVLQENRAPTFNGTDELDSLYAVRDLQIYVDVVDYLGEILGGAKWKSEIFNSLKEGIDKIIADEDYEKIKAAIPENTRILAQMQSVTLGVNVDSGLHPIEAGIISVNAEKFVSGSIVDKMLRMDTGNNDFQCAAPLSYPGNILTAKEEKLNFESAVNHALYKIVRSSIRSWKPAIKAYTNARTDFLIKYYNDLRFFAAGAEFFRKLRSMRYPVCRPEVRPAGEKKCTLKGVYFPEAVLDGIPMIGNDLEFDDNGRIYIFDGANGGGKTIFAKAAAVCQGLFQLGLFVPAESAQISPADEILLHLPSAGKNIAISRFTEECEKMSELMKTAGDNSFIVCDEAFSGTSSFEACAIAGEVLKAMSAKGCRGIFITHIHELARMPELINPLDVCRSKLDNLTVKIDVKSGKRLYKVARGETSGLSYAKDIADKYGLSFEQLMGSEK